jgi:hypothetical protein
MKTVHILLAAATSAAAALALGAVLQMRRPAEAGPAARHEPPQQHASQRVQDAPQPALHRRPWTAASADPFRSVSFVPPPPPPVAVQTPAPAVAEKPVAPPFPYQFFGRMIGVDGKTLTFLMRDGNLVPVRQGDIIDGNYRIDAASDSQLQVTYLPLNEQSTLTLQSAAP